MTTNSSPESQKVDTEVMLFRTVEGKEALAMGKVFGKNLSEVQAVSTNPDILAREALHTYDGIESAIEAAEVASYVELSTAERRELIMQVLDMNRSNRERALEQEKYELEQQRQYFLDQATPEERAAFYERFPVYVSIDTDEIQQLIVEATEKHDVHTNPIEWLKRPMQALAGWATGHLVTVSK